MTKGFCVFFSFCEKIWLLFAIFHPLKYEGGVNFHVFLTLKCPWLVFDLIFIYQCVSECHFSRLIEICHMFFIEWVRKIVWLWLYFHYLWVWEGDGDRLLKNCHNCQHVISLLDHSLYWVTTFTLPKLQVKRIEKGKNIHRY